MYSAQGQAGQNYDAFSHSASPALVPTCCWCWWDHCIGGWPRLHDIHSSTVGVLLQSAGSFWASAGCCSPHSPQKGWICYSTSESVATNDDTATTANYDEATTPKPNNPDKHSNWIEDGWDTPGGFAKIDSWWFENPNGTLFSANATNDNTSFIRSSWWKVKMNLNYREKFNFLSNKKRHWFRWQKII